jgi:hypothetical protein
VAQSERFYFWRGYYDALKKMPTDEQRGKFVMAVCAYAFDDVEPDFDGDVLLDICWSLVADGTRESVRKGVEQSQRGQMGGRPPKGAKTTAKSGVKSGAKTTAESEEKRKEKKGSELSPSTTEREFATLTGACAPAPDGAARAPLIDPMLDVPPRPEGDPWQA